MKIPSLSLTPLWWKKAFLVLLPPLILQLPFQTASFHPQRLAPPQARSREATWAPPGQQARRRPGAAGFAQHLSQAGRHSAWHHHSKSKDHASLKRLGAPGPKCLRYHTEYPEIISPLHNPTTWPCGGGGDLSSHTHTLRKKYWKEMTKKNIPPSYLCWRWLWSWGIFLSFQFSDFPFSYNYIIISYNHTLLDKSIPC